MSVLSLSEFEGRGGVKGGTLGGGGRGVLIVSWGDDYNSEVLRA